MTAKPVPTLRPLPDQELVKADLAGARVAIHSLGAPVGWPSLHCGTVDLAGGPDGWTAVLADLGWVKLALLWRDLPGVIDRCEEVIEERVNQRTAKYQRPADNGARASEPNAPRPTKGQETVPILEWKENTSMLDPGAYAAEVTAIEETTGEFGPQLKFTFTILGTDGQPTLDPEGNPIEQWGWCSAKWHEKSKLYTWVKALLRGKGPGPGNGLDTDILLKKKCDIVLAEKIGPNGTRTKLEEVVAYRTYTGADEF